MMSADCGPRPGTPDEPPFVVVSDLRVDELGAATLEEAFRNRLGEVDDWPGFRELQVWRDERDAERFVMVSWWRCRSDYVAYMRSSAHHRSHARIPVEPAAPRAVGVGTFRLVAR
jgi:heme-degrading monooxygenase HmoA